MNLDDNVRLIHLDIPVTWEITRDALYPYLADFFSLLENFRSNQNLNYHIIHSHYWLSGLLGNWAQRLWKRPHIVTFHTLGAVKNTTGIGNRETELRISTEKEISNSCHRILAPTQREKESLVICYHANPCKVGIVPCGVNLDLFFPVDKLVARNRLMLDSNDRIVLYVGRLDPLKGIDRLFGAMFHLKNFSRLRLIIVGGDRNADPILQHLKHRAAALGIDDRVVFTGGIAQKQLPDFYGSADAVVIPSYYESFGLVGLEALACGRPVISTPVGAMESLIQQKNGVLVTNPSPITIAKGIEAIFHRLKLFKAERIRETVLKYSWSIVSSAVLEEYENTIRMKQELEELHCCTEPLGNEKTQLRKKYWQKKASRSFSPTSACCPCCV